MLFLVQKLAREPQTGVRVPRMTGFPWQLFESMTIRSSIALREYALTPAFAWGQTLDLQRH